MKRLFLFPLIAAAALLSGCANDHVIHMRDGSTKVVEGKPVLDKATGMVIYTDESGTQQAVQQSDIKEMDSL
ncbi:YgdI/YgdR family lipoprotein [Erwinia sp.]|uniref:YgdI/YgdR family lipoprotein n=1 Tax=Erwinia citreus TaxID=558 RepID=UPI002898B122|nr:YgdI/YgdR family lipoprotein [Erwinia sp.]